MDKKVYYYKGPICAYGRCVSSDWEGVTFATTKDKALTNLAYQFKMASGKSAGSRVELDPKYLIRRS